MRIATSSFIPFQIGNASVDSMEQSPFRRTPTRPEAN